MIELEIQYRDLLVSKSQNEGHVRTRINDAANQNGDMRTQVEKMKEQIHLLQLKNNQVTSDIKRQRTINQARQDEIAALQVECTKKDREALELKGQLDGIVHDTYTTNIDAERQQIENENIQAQNKQ